jgi:hypothetical protein
MNLESQVCSLDLAKKLHELGVKKDSTFVWKSYDGEYYQVKFISFNLCLDDELYPAYTASELGDMLPSSLEVNDSSSSFLYCCKHSDDNWTIEYRYNRIINDGLVDEVTYVYSNCHEDTESNARATMIIYLIENGLISVTKL